MKRKTPTLLVCADSHGDMFSLARVFIWAGKQEIKNIAFLGDGIQDLAPAMARARYYPNIYAVKGNNDWGAQETDQRLIDFAGKKFFLSPGHRHGVSYNISRLLNIAQDLGAEVLLYGHTHRMFQEEYQGILALCPGSTSRPRGRNPAGFATISCPEDGWFLPRFWSLEESRIKEIFLE